MDIFDTDLFAPNKKPFAAYLEPDGYAALAERKRPRENDYTRLVPRTVEVAEALFSGIRQREKWGRQVHTREGAQWITEVRYALYGARGGRTRPGKALTVTELIRSVSRADVYAYGRTDAHVEERETDAFRPHVFRTTLVDVLLLDIDMDEAWRRQDRGDIRLEIARESMFARALGLPYRAFRTGGRGHQVVLPLPGAVDRVAAWWLLYAYRSLLEPFHTVPDTKADVSNLDSIVRIAGGRHIQTGRLALWIDPVVGDLYALERQVEMMKTGYLHPGGGVLSRAAFVTAADEIAVFLSAQGVARYLAPQGLVADLLFWMVVEALPDNPLIVSFSMAEEEWGIDGGQAPPSQNRALTQERSDRANAPIVKATTDGLTRWARRVWEVDWMQSGVFWDWISEGGQRGITAAKLLFGDEALSRMIERTYTADGVSFGKAAERRRVIRALFTKHVMHVHLNRRSIFGKLADEPLVLIPAIVDALQAKKRIQERNREDIEHLIYVILLATQEAPEGFFDVSLDTLRDSILERWPESRIDRSTVGRHLRRLKDGETDCGFSLIQEIRRDRGGVVPASRYRPGPDLRLTTWGSRLPFDDQEDEYETPVTGSYRSAVTGKLTTVEFGNPKPRGRKRKSRAEE